MARRQKHPRIIKRLSRPSLPEHTSPTPSETRKTTSENHVASRLKATRTRQETADRQPRLPRHFPLARKGEGPTRLEPHWLEKSIFSHPQARSEERDARGPKSRRLGERLVQCLRCPKGVQGRRSPAFPGTRGRGAAASMSR